MGFNTALENSIRAAAAIMPPHPINDPAWYQKSAAFYIFVPMLEIIVVVLYAVTRADKRFFVDGMNKADSEKTVGDTVVEKDHDQSSRNMSSAEVDDLDV